MMNRIKRKRSVLHTGFLVAIMVLMAFLSNSCVIEENVCEEGQRDCMDDNFVMICGLGTLKGNHLAGTVGTVWYSMECEKGCFKGHCREGKVLREIKTDCYHNSTQCNDGQWEVCLDGVWFKMPYTTPCH